MEKRGADRRRIISRNRGGSQYGSSRRNSVSCIPHFLLSWTGSGKLYVLSDPCNKVTEGGSDRVYQEIQTGDIARAEKQFP